MNAQTTLEDEMMFLAEEIQDAEKNLRILTGRQYNGVREDAIIFCLKRAYDIARGISIAATAELPETVDILTRSLFEVFIQIYWIALSDDNAKKFSETTTNDMQRQIRGNLKKEYGTVFDKETREDKSTELLQEWASLPQILNFQTMADEAGMGKLCKMMYGSLSMLAHGFTFGLSERLTLREQLDGSISSSVASMQAINSVAIKWITRREQIPPADMYALLGISKYNV